MKPNKILYWFFASALVFFTSCGLLSCSNDESLNLEFQNNSLRSVNSEEIGQTKYDEVINSVEFEEFVKANYKFSKMLQKQDSLIKKNKTKITNMGVTSDSLLTYKVYPIEVDLNLRDEVVSKTKLLQDRFPQIKTFKSNEFKSAILKAIKNSSRVSRILSENGFIVRNKKTRLKSQTEADLLIFSSVKEAYLNAMFYSMVSGVECAGFILADGTAVLSIDANNTSNKSFSPPFAPDCNSNGTSNNTYNGNVIVTYFHTHFMSGTPSETDRNAMVGTFCDQTMAVLYDGKVYYYQYTNGVNTYSYVANP